MLTPRGARCSTPASTESEFQKPAAFAIVDVVVVRIVSTC